MDRGETEASPGNDGVPDRDHQHYQHRHQCPNRLKVEAEFGASGQYPQEATQPPKALGAQLARADNEVGGNPEEVAQLKGLPY
jgi:hypothetical protein